MKRHLPVGTIILRVALAIAAPTLALFTGPLQAPVPTSFAAVHPHVSYQHIVGWRDFAGDGTNSAASSLTSFSIAPTTAFTVTYTPGVAEYGPAIDAQGDENTVDANGVVRSFSASNGQFSVSPLSRWSAVPGSAITLTIPLAPQPVVGPDDNTYVALTTSLGAGVLQQVDPYGNAHVVYTNPAGAPFSSTPTYCGGGWVEGDTAGHLVATIAPQAVRLANVFDLSQYHNAGVTAGASSAFFGKPACVASGSSYTLYVASTDKAPASGQYATGTLFSLTPNTTPLTGGTFAGTNGYTVNWAVPLQGVAEGAVVYDAAAGLVLVEDSSGALTAVNSALGMASTITGLGNVGMLSPAVDPNSGIVYTDDAFGNLWALTSGLTPESSFGTGGRVALIDGAGGDFVAAQGPIVDGAGRVYDNDTDGTVDCVQPVTGTILWHAGPPGITLPIGANYSGLTIGNDGTLWEAAQGAVYGLYAPQSGAALYPRLEQAHPSLPVLPASYHFGIWDDASSAQGPNADLLSASPGTGQHASATVPLPVAGDASPSIALAGQFLSPPLAAQTLVAGNWTAGLGVSALPNQGTHSRYAGYIALFLVNGSTGQVRSTLFTAQIGVDRGNTFGTEFTAYGTANAPAVAVQAGDYLDAEIGAVNTDYRSSVNATVYTSGTTPISSDAVGTSSAASFIQSPGPISFE